MAETTRPDECVPPDESTDSCALDKVLECTLNDMIAEEQHSKQQQEEIKQEELKQEELKQEELKQEQLKQEQQQDVSENQKRNSAEDETAKEDEEVLPPQQPVLEETKKANMLETKTTFVSSGVSVENIANFATLVIATQKAGFGVFICKKQLHQSTILLNVGSNRMNLDLNGVVQVNNQLASILFSLIFPAQVGSMTYKGSNNIITKSFLQSMRCPENCIFSRLLLHPANKVKKTPGQSTYYKMKYIQHTTTMGAYALKLPPPENVHFETPQDVLNYCAQYKSKLRISALQILFARVTYARIANKTVYVNKQNNPFTPEVLKTLCCPEEIKSISLR